MTTRLFSGRWCTIPVCSMLLMACSSSKPPDQDQTSRQDSKKERKSPLADYEATLNPSDFNEEVETVQKAHASEGALSPQLVIPKDSVSVEEVVIQGFRIQIFSSASVDDANASKVGAQEKFVQDSVYVEYDAPVYKVRVGDFVNRYEANQRLPEFVDKGYKDAWVVPDRIVQRKVVNVPRQVPR